MRKLLFIVLAILLFVAAHAQPPELTAAEKRSGFTNQVMLAATPVKNQGMSGTCWCFSTTSLVESQVMKNTKEELDISEIFTVRNIYIEKAKNYILRQGKAQFGEGGLGHDLIRSIGTYGAIPESVYSGLKEGVTMHNHSRMEAQLQKYLDSLLKVRPVPATWLDGYTAILDQYLGAPPTTFQYNGKSYTPVSFAKDEMKFNADDYVNITSFTHHPYYQSFILETPDNFANGLFYNLPLNEMIALVKDAVKGGYSVMWDADVSNNGFRQNKGLALFLDPNVKYKPEGLDADMSEQAWDAAERQQLYENLTTEDDHLMHITGTEQSKAGKLFFVVKNSWGNIGPYDGYINVSESYFAINTVSLVVPKAALSKQLLAKLKIQ